MSRRPRYRRDDFEPEPPKRGAGLLWLWLALVGVALAGAVTVLLILLLSGGSGGPAGPGGDNPGPPPDVRTGLIAHWSFDDVQGGKVTDGSGRGHHAQLVNCRIAPGAFGNGVSFGGRPEEFVDLGRDAGLNFPTGKNFAFSGWVNIKGGDGTILSFRKEGDGSPVIDLTIEAGNLALCLRDGVNEFDEKWIKGPALFTERWHHFAFCRDRDTMELFLDGVLCGHARSHRIAGDIFTDLRALGLERYWLRAGWVGKASFSGSIDEVRVFDRALRADEIKALAKR